MKLKEIHRTSTFAWSPTASLPLLATGTVAGALDESFSNESQLEIWAPDFLDKHEFDLGSEGHHGPKGVVPDVARFNRLAWGYVEGTRPRGVIAAGMENGELVLWDPVKILEGKGPTEASILRNTTHSGPIRGLDFNPIQTSLLSTGAVNGEVYIWDLKDPSKPYSPTPGTRSTKLDEITSVAWNQQVPSVLAGASSTGYTVVWDLRGKREVVALAYGGGAGTMAGQGGAGSGLAVGGRRGMSAIAWHPDNATRLVTASEDDSSPIIMVWDLRNARAPEKILTGHEKGVLSLSWCKQDADLLLSCGKDNRALCWNPQTSEIIGELPSADNWAFQVEWCPRNPDLLATAFFDGTVGIHSIQSTNDSVGGTQTPDPQTDGADIFDVPGFSRSTQGATLSLKQPPKWLRRPTSNSFGFGGKLVTVSNLASSQGKNQSSVVHVRKVVTERELVDRAFKLQAAIQDQTLSGFAEGKSDQSVAKTADGAAGWKALLSLFRADSRDELVTLLGFSKLEIAARVAEAVETLKTAATDVSTLKSSSEVDITDHKMHEPVVSFAEPERQEDSSEGEADENGDVCEKTPSEKTPSEISGSGVSDTARLDGESTTTASLFGDDNANGIAPADDFFSTMNIGGQGGQSRVLVPHHNYPIDSSVAATIGSGPSSVISDSAKSTNFRIYPIDESEMDRLVTKALVLGDFESAVSLCLSSDRFADAILLAVKGGPELLQRTQKAYFERRTVALPYLRLFQSIVTNDLADIVQNADLQDWQEIFVVLCTFASQEEFPSLAEQLGIRLEFQFTLAKASDAPGAATRAHEFRKNATLTYLAAGRLERLVNIWIQEMGEEEKDIVSDGKQLDGSLYTAHAHALQTFIERVTVFRSAIKYDDVDLKQTPNGNAIAKTYKLSNLYDLYFEYADLLATQGLVQEAVAFLNLSPSDYKGSDGSGSSIDFGTGKDRLLNAAKVAAVPTVSSTVPASTPPAVGYAQPQYVHPSAPAPVGQSQAAPSSIYAPYNPSGSSSLGAGVNHSYPASTSHQASYQAAAPAYSNTYGSSQSLTQPPHLRSQPQPAPPMVPPPPRASSDPTGSGANAPPGPPQKRNENGGWNDAPVMNSERRTPGALNLNKPAAIVSPFPNAAPPLTPGVSPGISPYMSPGQPPAPLPPPPRPGSVQARLPPPPPPQGQRLSVPQLGTTGTYPPPNRPPSGPPGHPQNMPPPSQLMSPPQGQGTQQPPPGQYGPPASRGPAPGQTPGSYGQPTSQPGPHGVAATPPGRYAHAAPPPGPQGPYNSGPAPARQQQGLYGAPQGIHNPASPPQPLHMAGPPPPTVGRGPPNAVPSRMVQKGPPPPKYPIGDRSHIPESARPAYNVILDQLNHMRQTTPLQQKRLVDDLERRINPLFDALNCDTLSQPVVDQLLVLARAIESHDRGAALSIHVDLLTRGSQTDDIGLWMSGIKQLIMRL